MTRKLRTTRRFALVASLVAAAARPAAAEVLEPGWTDALWLSSGVDIAGMAWAPDGSGRLFLAGKTGHIRIVKAGPPPFVVATPFATVSPLFTDNENGVIGLAFDPDFLVNGYLYVFATVSPTEQHLLRYTVVGDSGTDKTVLVTGLPNGVVHNGGAVGVGRDGRLYWAVGDLGASQGVNADLASLASKVGRAERDGSVPVDNPFADGAGGNHDSIFARGFRNPFSFTFQPTTGMLWVNVTGGGFEQVFAVGAGDHGGWNDYEDNQPDGFLIPRIAYHTNGVDVRFLAFPDGAVRANGVATFKILSPHYFRQGEKVTIAGVSDPSFHGELYVGTIPTPSSFTALQAGPDAVGWGGTATTQDQGGAITGGTFYDSSGAPEAYRGNFFYGDFNSGRMNRAIVGPGTTVTQVDYFAVGNPSSVDMAVGPDGALYWASFGGVIRRTAYDAQAQGLVVSNLHLWMTEGRRIGTTVSLALPPSGNTSVTVARVAGSTDVGVSGGAALAFTPANFDVPQLVTFDAAADADAVADFATFSVSSAGLAGVSVEVRVNDTDALAGGFVPGTVPDGDAVPGSPLRLGRNTADAAKLDLAWGASCSGTAEDYSVHQGTLGGWYGHTFLLCSTGAATEATITPGTGDHYFLVVALDETREGSYGTDSAGTERPPSGASCRPEHAPLACP
jgi:glucose/arabinose dehydrogenase